MFNWLSNLFVGAAFDVAIYSAGLASANGLHQIKEPENLQKVAQEHKEIRKDVK